MHKNGISKNTNLLENIPEKVLKYITKKWIEVHDQSDNTNDRWKSKHQCYIQIYVITVILILFSKELLLLQEQIIEIEKIDL